MGVSNGSGPLIHVAELEALHQFLPFPGPFVWSIGGLDGVLGGLLRLLYRRSDLIVDFVSRRADVFPHLRPSTFGVLCVTLCLCDKHL